MDLLSLLAPMLAISFLIERLLEAAFDIIEMIPRLKAMLLKTPQMKQIISVVVGVILGIIIGAILGVNFFASTGQRVDPNIDKLLTGAIAGAIAPYAHQILELLLKLQKFFDAKKAEVEKTAGKVK